MESALWRTGPAESFPKIKVPTRFGAFQKVNKIVPAAGQIAARTAPLARQFTKALSRLVSQPRLILHAALVTAVAAIVFTSSGASTHFAAVNVLSNQTGYGALDQTATAVAAADIAAKANLAVSSDANAKASDLKGQVALATSDDNYLAKRQVIATAGTASRTISTYTVQAGETLSGIANKFGITSSTIKWANGLDDENAITPGDSLTILPVSGLSYTVAAGDTADSLAKKYQANADQIISFNNAEVKGLQPGQKIIIPDGVKEEAPAPAPAPVARTVAAPRLTYYAGSGNGYAFGYCTWYVASRRSVPSNWGNAVSWYYMAQASGWAVGSVPVPGAIGWDSWNSWGAGHVTYVEQVSGNQVLISEMNGVAGWDRVGYRWAPISEFRYIY